MFKQKLFFVGILKVNDEKSRIRIKDPDPFVRGMDPRIRIRILSKMSWIRNTDFYFSITKLFFSFKVRNNWKESGFLLTA
jgi:hypothetical protein